MNMLDKTTMTISVSGLEIAALQKLSLVNHALASKLDYRASEEQKALVSILDDLIRQIAMSAGRAA